MKVVILAGGKGTRLKEKTQEIPKPLLMVGDRPILQHIIDLYVQAGFDDFILPVGYLGDQILRYFYGWGFDKKFDTAYDSYTIVKTGYRVTVVPTGLETQTGGRIKRLHSAGLLNDPFLMTYGDGIGNVDVKAVAELGYLLNKNIVTSVHPVPRFGSMVLSPDGDIVSFGEKVINPHDWINGGFMYLKPEIFQHINKDDCNLEKDVLPKLSTNCDLHAFIHEGLWHPIDTIRDLELANEMYNDNKFSWVK